MSESKREIERYAPCKVGEDERARLRAMGFTHSLASLKTGELRSRHKGRKAALRALVVPLQAYYRVVPL